MYNPKLNVNFFGDKNANYKLVKMGQGKWQVVRTDKNGRKAKTPVFTYDVDYSYYTHGPYSLIAFEQGHKVATGTSIVI